MRFHPRRSGQVRATRPGAEKDAPYQTQINDELRALMEQGRLATSRAELIADQEFTQAVALRVKELAPAH